MLDEALEDTAGIGSFTTRSLIPGKAGLSSSVTDFGWVRRRK